MPVKIGILSAALISNDFVISLRNLDPTSYKVQKVESKFVLPIIKYY